MHYLKRLTRKNGEDAVSPVVGVMLMLVVTIIIAAVVSAFSGGLIGGNNQKTPTLTMDVKITTSGNTSNAGFYGEILSISEPTSSKDVELVTSWRAKNATTGAYSVAGGATSVPITTAPYGFGPGISGTTNITTPSTNQYFGNYTLMQGTGLVAEGSAATNVLGTNWNLLNAGDTVSVSVIHIPTGRSIFQKTVVVTGV
jgi:FlaG/FlaF family flagellin (archaellin)